MNVGVLVTCLHTCLLHFEVERTVPVRAKALFPKQNEQTFAAALEALRQEMERVKGRAHDPKAVQMAFNESVRIRGSIFRYGEIRPPSPQTLKTSLRNFSAAMCEWKHLRPTTRIWRRPDSPRETAS